MKLLKKSALIFASISMGAVSTSSAAIIASIGGEVATNEFSGVQGQDGWSYGYWDLTNDASPDTYTHTSDFTTFKGGSGSADAWGDTNDWNNNRWDFNPDGDSNGNPPWTTITGTQMHPNDSAPGDAHAAILRYTVEDGTTNFPVMITGFFNNVSANGDGTTGRILLNGVEQFSVLTDGTSDNLGGGVNLPAVTPGDTIDFMVDVGPADADGSDGTGYGFTIETTIPEPGSSMLLLLGGLALLGRRRR